ncbi:MAG: GNAT family N-acetyltransferase [Salinarimonadaceae bacterium]|nr:MAG: GNAT family N-acetyltransferase [Salinarimonadaceae bacterium]
MAVVIRDVIPADEEAIIALIDALNRYEAGLVDDRRTDITAARECLDRDRERIAESGGALLAACEGERVVGFLALVFGRDEPYVLPRFRDYAMIAELVVDAEARGAGIGRALIAEAERRARERGLERITVAALAVNKGALAAYSAAGYGDYMVTLERRLG